MMHVAADVAIRSISFYQKAISHRKGYACAFRVLHKDLSCSEFVKNEIELQGLLKGIRSALERFSACQHAAIEIKAAHLSNPLVSSEMLREAVCCCCITLP